MTTDQALRDLWHTRHDDDPDDRDIVPAPFGPDLEQGEQP